MRGRIRTFSVDCEECARLCAKYDRLKKAHIAAVEAINGAWPPEELLRLRTVSDDAWLDAEIARLEVNRHIERHHGTPAVSSAPRARAAGC
jgi:hypothetical protein